MRSGRTLRFLSDSLSRLPLAFFLLVLLGPLAISLGEALVAWRQWLPAFTMLARLGPLTANTCVFVLGTLAIALPVGAAGATILFRLDVPGRRAGLVLIIVAMALPLSLHAAGWMAALGTRGWLRDAWSWVTRGMEVRVPPGLPPLRGMIGAIWVQSWAMVPWVVVVVGIGLVGVERELEEDALLAAGWGRTILRVTMRRAAGFLGAAAVMVIVLTAGDMTITDLFQVRTYAEEIYTQFVLERRTVAGSVLATAGPGTLVVWGLLLVLVARMVRSVPGRVNGFQEALRFGTGSWRWPLAVLILAGLIPVLGIPIASLVWKAGWVPPRLASGEPPRWAIPVVVETLARTINPGRTGTVPELGYSLLWGGIGAAVSAAGALVLVWSARCGGWFSSWLVAGVAAMSLALPGPVIGVSLATALNRPGLLGLIYDSSLILAWAYALRTLPYAILAIWPLVQMIPGEVLDAATVDGAGRWRRYWTVQVPLSMMAVGTGFLIAWVLAVDELAASVIVVPPRATTLISVRIFQMLHFGLERDLAGAGLLLVGVVVTMGTVALMLIEGDRRFGVRKPSRTPSLVFPPGAVGR